MLLEISFIFLSQDCFGYLGSFEIPHEFQNFFSISAKKTQKNIEILIGILLTLRLL